MLNFKYQKAIGYRLGQVNIIKKTTFKNKIAVGVFFLIYTILSIYAFFPIIDSYLQGYIKIVQQLVFYTFLLVMLLKFIMLRRKGILPTVEFAEVSVLKLFLNDKKFNFIHLDLCRCLALMALNDKEVEGFKVKRSVFNNLTISEVKQILDSRPDDVKCSPAEIKAIASAYIKDKINDSKTFSEVIMKC